MTPTTDETLTETIGTMLAKGPGNESDLDELDDDEFEDEDLDELDDDEFEDDEDWEDEEDLEDDEEA